MAKEKMKTDVIGDALTAVGAASYGVPKSLIFGFFVQRFFHNREAAREQAEEDHQRTQLEQELEHKRIELGLRLHALKKAKGLTLEFREGRAVYEEHFGPLPSWELFKQSIPGAQPEENGYRRVSVLLGIGIFFMPYLFSWLTLRNGYSKGVRIVALAWMIFVVVMLVVTGNSKPPVTKTLAQPTSPVAVNTVIPTIKAELTNLAAMPDLPSEKPSIKTPDVAAISAPSATQDESSIESTTNLASTISPHPSFDCDKASNTVEHLICSNTKLSESDLALSRVFKAALQIAGSEREQALKQDQNNWRKHDRDVCIDSACIAGAYESRIAALKKYQ